MEVFVLMTSLSLFSFAGQASHEEPVVEQDRVESLIYGRQEPLEFADACGPIAVMASAQIFGVKISLSDAIRRCDWEPGSGTSVAKLESVMEDLTSRAFDVREFEKTTPPIVGTSISPGSIIIMRRPSAAGSHAVVLLGTTDAGWRVFDYPAMERVIPVSVVNEQWDRVAILPAASFVDNVLALPFRFPLTLASGGLAAIIAIGGRRLDRCKTS